MPIRRMIRTVIAGFLIMSLWLSGTALAQSDKKPTLNVAIASNFTAFGDLWIALARNLFDKHGVDVKVVSYNAVTSGGAVLTSKTADILTIGANFGVRVAAEGKAVSYVYNLADMNATIATFVSSASIKSLEELSAKGNDCRMITIPQSVLSAMVAGVMERYNIRCKISVTNTIPSIIAGVASGQYDAAMVNHQDAVAARDAGKVNILVDPTKTSKEELSKIYPSRHPQYVAMGLPDNLASKRTAVVRFIAALQEANGILQGLTTAQLADECRKIPEAFGTLQSSAIQAQWELTKPLINDGPNAGRISRESWDAFRTALGSLWGMPKSLVDNPQIQYDAIVDMSYFDEAAKKN